MNVTRANHLTDAGVKLGLFLQEALLAGEYVENLLVLAGD